MRKRNNRQSYVTKRLMLILTADRAATQTGIINIINEDIFNVLSKYGKVNKDNANITIIDNDEEKVIVAKVPIMDMNVKHT